MAKQSELKSILDSAAAALERAKGEIITKVSALTNEVERLTVLLQQDDKDLTPEVQASVDKIVAISKEIDDLNPDNP